MGGQRKGNGRVAHHSTPTPRRMKSVSTLLRATAPACRRQSGGCACDLHLCVSRAVVRPCVLQDPPHKLDLPATPSIVSHTVRGFHRQTKHQRRGGGGVRHLITGLVCGACQPEPQRLAVGCLPVVGGYREDPGTPARGVPPPLRAERAGHRPCRCVSMSAGGGSCGDTPARRRQRRGSAPHASCSRSPQPASAQILPC